LIEQKPGAFMIAHLPFRQKQDHGLALAVADGVELGIQPPFGSSDAAGGPPFSADWRLCGALSGEWNRS
jgi:hypothetical protein